VELGGKEKNAQDEGVEVDVEIDRPAEPLDRGDSGRPRLGRTEPSRGPALPGEDGSGEDV
jgi:hypothetical protein